MESSDEYTKALNEVFRRIGRNVFVFQQIELLLKTLLNNGRFEGTATELKKRLAERATKPDKRMLGQLIDPLIDYHLTPAEPESAPLKNATEITVSFVVTFNHTAEERAVFQKELEAIVAERNDLIHTRLLRFRFNSEASCLEAIKDLERQEAKITPVRNRLRAMVRVMEDMKPELLRALQDMRRDQSVG